MRGIERYDNTKRDWVRNENVRAKMGIVLIVLKMVCRTHADVSIRK